MRGDPRPGILHIVNSLDGGGTERALLRLLNAFDRTRFRHSVITLRHGGSLTADLPPHVACHVLNTNGNGTTLGPTIARIAKQERAVLMHARNTCCWSDATVAKYLAPRTALALGFHGLDHAGRFSRRDRIITAAARLAGARFTSVSNSGCDKLIAELRVPRHRLQWLPNGVVASVPTEDARLTRSNMRASFGFTGEDVVLGIVGSLTNVKRHDLLLAAVHRLRDTAPRIRLLVIGDGPNRAALETSVRQNEMAPLVHFAGWRDDPEACLRAMDIYACTSDSEGMSNAVLEATAAGLPIVATDAGDNALIVRHGTAGLIVPRGDVTAITKGVLRLTNDPTKRARFGRCAKKASAQFDLSRVARAYDDYYSAVAANQAENGTHRHAIDRVKASDPVGSTAQWPGPIIPDAV